MVKVKGRKEKKNIFHWRKEKSRIDVSVNKQTDDSLEKADKSQKKEDGAKDSGRCKLTWMDVCVCVCAVPARAAAAVKENPFGSR